MENETIFLTRASLPQYKEYAEEIKSIWDNNWITSFGPKHCELEQKLKEYLRCKEVAVFSNGHNALEMALQALDSDGEIITTPYTFASTTNAIVRSGYTPVFCDIVASTFNMDPTKIEHLITEKTCAILPVHVYGNICDVEKIDKIAQKYNLKVIYDAAHAFGVEYKGNSVATYGDAVIFSFHASKLFNTAEGGAVCFKDDKFGERLRCIRNFGIVDGNGCFPAGNGKMSELSAALGLCNLRHISDYINRRRSLSRLYEEYLSDIDELTFRVSQEQASYNYAYFPVIVADEKVRDDIFDYLHNHRVLCQKHFEFPTNSFSCYKGLFRGDTPIAAELSRKTLLLPLYSDLEKEQVIYICNLIHDIFR
jgi:hypothetical protein